MLFRRAYSLMVFLYRFGDAAYDPRAYCLVSMARRQRPERPRTCRPFGISRATYYYWQHRFDPTRPAQSLRRKRSRMPTRGAPKAALFLRAVIGLQVAHPRWGRRRIRTALRALRDDAPSEATIGRWPEQILTRCPICRGKEGRHDEGPHALSDDLNDLDLAVPLRPLRRSPAEQASDAVAEVERVIRRNTKRNP
jgi:hypothetical protein